MPAQALEERVWFDDPRGFVRDDRLALFIPWPNSSLAEKLNALMRFALYYAAFLFLFQRTYAVVYIPLVVALVTYLVFRADGRGEEEGLAPAPGHSRSEALTSSSCSKPTLDNPFMNVLVSDYVDQPERPPACDIGRSSVKRAAESNFASNLYRDVDDVFERRSSSRQFYTTPNTAIPNDQAGFAQWLYGNAQSGKEAPPGLAETGGDRSWASVRV
jgi:hypothetical protein